MCVCGEMGGGGGVASIILYDLKHSSFRKLVSFYHCSCLFTENVFFLLLPYF